MGQLLRRVCEGLRTLLGIRDCRRIGKAPVYLSRVTRENRAVLAGAVAHRDDVIERCIRKLASGLSKGDQPCLWPYPPISFPPGTLPPFELLGVTGGSEVLAVRTGGETIGATGG